MSQAPRFKAQGTINCWYDKNVSQKGQGLLGTLRDFYIAMHYVSLVLSTSLNDAYVDQTLDNPNTSIKVIFHLNLLAHQKSRLA